MVNLAEDIHPLTDFKRDTVSFLKRMRRSKRAVVLTVNGKAELIVQDAASYQQMLQRLERMESVEAIRAGLTDVAEGRVHNARRALKALQVKLGIPD